MVQKYDAWIAISHEFWLAVKLQYKVFTRQLSERPVSRGAIYLTLLFLILNTLWYTLQTELHSYKYSKDTIIGPYLKIRPKGNVSRTGHNMPIPRIIHQTWKSSKVSVIFQPWIKSCIELNPDWEYWFWTDQDMRRLIATKYPWFLNIYDNYPRSIYRADAFRYFLLHEYGGLYADLDIECLKPFHKAVSDKSCVFSTEPETHAQFLTKVDGPLLSNALIACSAGHSFLKHIAQNLIYYTGPFSFTDVLHATGPFLVTNLYREYSSKIHWFADRKDLVVHLAEPETFQPTIDESMVDQLREMCLANRWDLFESRDSFEREKRVCNFILGKDFRNGPRDHSVTDHHWTHTWGGLRNDPWGIMNDPRQFDIEEFKNIRKS